MAPPRKRVVNPALANVAGPVTGYQNVPYDVVTPWRAYWDSFGTLLPDGLNRQARVRRSMLRLVR